MKYLLTLLVMLLSLPSIASDLQQQQSPLYPYQSSIMMQDDFLGGDTNQNVGNLGWSVNGGATNNGTSTGSRMGLINRATGAAIVNAFTFLYASVSAAINPSLNVDITWVYRPNTVDANTEYRLGAFSGIVSNPPTDGMYFEKLAADTNFFCVNRAGGVQTRVDSGVAVTAATFYDLRFSRSSSGVSFILNNATVCGSPITTNIPTVFLGPDAMIASTAAANKTMDLDFFRLIITGLTR